MSEAVEIAGAGITCVLPLRQKKIDVSETTAGFALHAHNNLELLQSNGCCFEESLASILKADVGHSAINAIQITSSIVQMVTGESNPFKLAQKIHLEPDIRNRLECYLMPYKYQKRIKDEFCLAPAKKQEFIALVNAWLRCNTRLYQIRNMPEDGPLKMVRVIHIMDKILETMFDIRFTRQENVIRFWEGLVQKSIYSYIARESTEFTMSWKVNTASPASASKVASLSAIQESLQACQNEHFVPS